MGKEVNVVVIGSEGKMGQIIADLVNKHPGWKVSAGIDQRDAKRDFPVYCSPQSMVNSANVKADLMIDFSSASAIHDIYRLAKKLGIPLLTGTTNLAGGTIKDMQEQKEIPVFQAYNMSNSVYQFIQDVCHTAKKRGDQGYDIDIIEVHGTKKKDAPSGTAWTLANAINEVLGGKYKTTLGCPDGERKPMEIRITSLRMDGFAGNHTVIFSKGSDFVKMEHNAGSREIFAEGAIKAAEFLLKQEPGYYNMSSIYGGYTD